MNEKTIKIDADIKPLSAALRMFESLAESSPGIIEQFHEVFPGPESLYWVEETKIAKDEIGIRLHPTDGFLEFLASADARALK